MFYWQNRVCATECFVVCVGKDEIKHTAQTGVCACVRLRLRVREFNSKVCEIGS